MILAEILDVHGGTIGHVWMRTAPHVGETIWLYQSSGRRCLKITEICHWLGTDWAPPEKGDGQPNHKLAIYTEDIE